MELESKLQSKVIKLLKDNGYIAIKILSSNYNGIPDIMALKDGNIIFLEIKTEKGIVSKLQDERIKQLTTQKFECHIIRSINQLKTILC